MAKGLAQVVEIAVLCEVLRVRQPYPASEGEHLMDPVTVQPADRSCDEAPP